MAEPTHDEFLKLVEEPDAFKLAILGHSAIETAIDAGIDEAFDHGVPKELSDAWFGIKLALAVAVGVVRPEYEGCFSALATLRNRFAHGEFASLTVQRATALADAFEPLFLAGSEDGPSEIRKVLRRAEPIWTLRSALIAAMGEVIDARGEALRRRIEERRIIQEDRARRQREQLAAVLAVLDEAQAEEGVSDSG